MEIDLLKTKIYIISPGTGHYRKRIEANFIQLVDRGFSRIEFVRSIPNISTTNSLSWTVLQILESESSGEPFIILEDDIDIYHFISSLTIPADACAVYLGLCRTVYPYPYFTVGFGFHIRSINPQDFTQCADTAHDSLVRVRGMMSGHSILFVDKDYIRKIATRIREHLEVLGRMEHVWHDLIMASTQLEHPVYALKNIMFFQAQKYHGRQDETLIRWENNTYVRDMDHPDTNR